MAKKRKTQSKHKNNFSHKSNEIKTIKENNNKKRKERDPSSNFCSPPALSLSHTNEIFHIMNFGL